MSTIRGMISLFTGSIYLDSKDAASFLPWPFLREPADFDGYCHDNDFFSTLSILEHEQHFLFSDHLALFSGLRI